MVCVVVCSEKYKQENVEHSERTEYYYYFIIMKAKIIVTLHIKNVTGALYKVNYNENTLSVSVSVNAAWNSVVLTARRNDCSEVAALIDEGRAFQARAAATGEARSVADTSETQWHVDILLLYMYLHVPL